MKGGHFTFQKDIKRFIRCPTCNQVFTGRKQRTKHLCPKAPAAHSDGEA